MINIIHTRDYNWGKQDILGGKEARIDWCQSGIVTTGSKQHRTVYSIERGESIKK